MMRELCLQWMIYKLRWINISNISAGSLKSADGNCNNYIISRIALAKTIMLDVVPIWGDRGINKELTLNYTGGLLHSLVRTVLI